MQHRDGDPLFVFSDVHLLSILWVDLVDMCSLPFGRVLQWTQASHGCLEERLVMKDTIEAALSIASNFQNIWTNPNGQVGSMRPDLPMLMASDMPMDITHSQSSCCPARQDHNDNGNHVSECSVDLLRLIWPQENQVFSSKTRI